MQASSFAATVRLERSPLCIHVPHCGHQVELGEPIDRGGCINTEMRCTHCQRTGVSSENTSLRKAKA